MRTLVTTYFSVVFAVLVIPRMAAFAQEPAEAEGPLPPVIVQPPAESEDQDVEPTLPPVEVRPPTGPTPETTPSEPPDSSLSFPSLSDLQLGTGGPFDQNSGILRSPRSLFDTPAAASLRTREEIAERQAPDMFQALQNEVGVLMQSTAAGQASPFIRGLTGQQVLILVDGIRLNNSITRRGPNQYFNTIDAGMVDHIEVLRGQGSVLWGSDAIGGTINVVTRGADVAHGRVLRRLLYARVHAVLQHIEFVAVQSPECRRLGRPGRRIRGWQFLQCS